jgi:hypothetical protein
MDAVMIEVRRVVGRENSNSQTTSLLLLLLLLACGYDVGQRNSVESTEEACLPRLEPQEYRYSTPTSPGPSFQTSSKEAPVIDRKDEVRGGGLRYRRNRGWAASI